MLIEGTAATLTGNPHRLCWNFLPLQASGEISVLEEARMTVPAYAAHAADKPLESMQIARREPGPSDVQIEIAYCGGCHSNLHAVQQLEVPFRDRQQHAFDVTICCKGARACKMRSNE